MCIFFRRVTIFFFLNNTKELTYFFYFVATEICDEIMIEDSELPSGAVSVIAGTVDNIDELAVGGTTVVTSDGVTVGISLGDENVPVDLVEFTSNGSPFTAVVKSVDENGVETTIATIQSEANEDGTQSIKYVSGFEATDIIIETTVDDGDMISMQVNACIHPSGRY